MNILKILLKRGVGDNYDSHKKVSGFYFNQGSDKVQTFAFIAVKEFFDRQTILHRRTLKFV